MLRLAIYPLALYLTLMSCGAFEDEPSADDPFTAVTNYITNIPKTVRAVTASPDSLSLAAADNKLATWSELGWGSDKSQAMCFAGDVLRTVLSEAAGPDLALCKLGVLEEFGLITVRYEDQIDYFKILNFGGATRYFKVTGRKSGQSLSEFKMYACDATGNQDSYVSTTLSGSESGFFASIRSVSAIDDGTVAGGQLATTSGMTNVRGDWLDKMVAFQAITETSELSRTAQISINQNSIDDFTMFGSFYGDYSGQDEASCFYTAGAIVNGDSLASLALGHGATSHDTNTSGQTCSGSAVIAAWSGDDRSPLSDVTGSSFYNTVAFATVPTLATFGAANVAFSGDDVWDCSADFIEVDLSEVADDVAAALAQCDADFTLPRTASDCRNASP